MSLSDLIARVEAASGPIPLTNATCGDIGRLLNFPMTDDGVFVKLNADAEIISGAFSGSLDSALALVERVLPGWRKELFETQSGGWGVHFREPHATDTQYAPTPALALILALLRALEAAQSSLTPTPQVAGAQRPSAPPATDEQNPHHDRLSTSDKPADERRKS